MLLEADTCCIPYVFVTLLAFIILKDEALSQMLRAGVSIELRLHCHQSIQPSSSQKFLGLDITALRSSFAALEVRRPRLVAWSFIVLPCFPILRVPIDDSNCFEAVPFHHVHNKQAISSRGLAE